MYALQLVHMDYLTIESPKDDNDINILIITDHFMHYAQAIMTSSQSAKVASSSGSMKPIYSALCLPKLILSDKGHNKV